VEATLEQFTPIIRLSKLEIELMCPMFKNTKALINAQIPFPGWGEVYKIFREEDYLDIVPPSDLSMRNIDDLVFINIRRSHLHTIATRTLVMPCS
jgi:hypothetical protein